MKSTPKVFNSIFIAAIALITSYASLSCELLIARFLSSLSLDSVLSQSVTIGTYLAGMGLGAFGADKIKINKTASTLILIEVLLSICVALSLYLVLMGHLYLEGVTAVAWISKTKILIFSSQTITLALGALAGFEIPLLLKLMGPEEKSFGFILGISYIGGLIGTISVNTVLIPTVGALDAALILSLVSGIVSVLVYFRFYLLKPHWSSLPILVSLALPPLLISQNTAFQQFYLKSYYYFAPMSWSWSDIKSTLQVHATLPDVRRVSSLYQEIDIVQDETHGVASGESFHLFLDHRLQFGSENERIYHDLMIHGAANLAKRSPHKVLILGGGDGLLMRELLKYPDLESVTLIELDPMMIELAKQDPHFLKLNESALSSSKIKVITADAFDWVRQSRESFDSIFVDLPHPHSFEISRLYSQEFYRFLYSRLDQDGFLVFDYPFYPLIRQAGQNPAGLSQAKSVIMSLKSAGFRDYAIYGFWESFIISFKKPWKFEFDYQKLSPLVSDMSVSQLTFLDKSIFESQQAVPNSIFKPQWLRSGFDGN